MKNNEDQVSPASSVQVDQVESQHGTTRKQLESHNFVHANGNLFCAVEVKTTGLDPNKHEIYEMCIIPITNTFERSQTIPWLDIMIQPNNIESIDWGGQYKCFSTKQVREAMDKGFTRSTAFDLIMQWFNERNLGGKRIVPVGCNYVFDSHFIKTNFGETFYNHIFFDHMARDVCVIAQFLNDISWLRSEKYPFPLYNLQWLVSALKIKMLVKGHSAVVDAAKVIEIYRGQMELMNRRMSPGVIEQFMDLKPNDSTES